MQQTTSWTVRIFLAAAVLLFSAKTLKGSDSLNQPGLSLNANVSELTLDTYLSKVHAYGLPIIIDCFDTHLIDEKLRGVISGDFSTSFYEIKFKDNVCYVSPKDIKNKSNFLNMSVPLMTTKGMTPSAAIKALGEKIGVKLTLYNPTILAFNQTMEFKGQTVEQILLSFAKACGTNRVVISPMMVDHNHTLPGAPVFISLYSPR